MKQVWGTLEVCSTLYEVLSLETYKPLQIVREQCWLNEILNGLQWTPEGLTAPTGPDQTDEGDATEADLQAVLGGSHT